MHWDALGTTFVTLTVLMDPVGVTPVFITTTARLERARPPAGGDPRGARRRRADPRLRVVRRSRPRLPERLVLGLVLSAIAVQLVVNGVRGIVEAS